MATVRLRTVDAFTERPFTGNPAAVLVLDEAPPDDWMAAVARETNLPDTGFVIREELPDADFRLRWFFLPTRARFATRTPTSTW